MDSSEQPKVSIITPAYNQGVFLIDTIESVLSQDYQNIELYVIDDGSTDDTAKILETYTGKIKWETQSNRGQTATINKGWRLTHGEIITWLNSDDTLIEGAVKKGVDYLVNHPETGIVFGDTLFTKADGTPIEKSRSLPPFNYRKFVVACENPIAQPSAFFRREIIEKAGDLDEQFYYFMDWDLWLRAGLHFRIDYIPELWSTYRLHAESKTVVQSKKAAPELEYMYKKFFSRGDLPPGISRLRKKAMMNMYFTSGSYYLNGDDRRSAARMARLAIKQNPIGFFSLKNLHKFLYCSFGKSRPYQQLRKIAHKKNNKLSTV
jgi:glycosyltransferase involved in cell wall biosynthesis